MAGLPRVVWVLAGGSLVNSFGSFVVPFLVLYLVQRGYSVGFAAGTVSAYAAGKLAAGPAGGLATDRLSPRAVTTASMAASAIATVALALAGGPVPILVTAAMTGLVSQLYRPATSAILAAEVPGPRRVKAFGVYQLGVSTGSTAGPAVGGLIAEHSFITLFIIDAATSLAWAILAWRTLPATQASPARPGGRGGPGGQPQGPHRMLSDRRLVRLLAVTVLTNLVLFQAQTTLPLWVHRQGLPTATYGLLLAFNSGLVVVLQLPATRIIVRWQARQVIAATSIIIGTGFALLALAHTAMLLAVAVTVWSLGELIQWPVAAAYATSLAPPGAIGGYAGARSFCYGLALLLAPLGSTLYSLNPAILWAACGAAGICAGAISSHAGSSCGLVPHPSANPQGGSHDSPHRSNTAGNRSRPGGWPVSPRSRRFTSDLPDPAPVRPRRDVRDPGRSRRRDHHRPSDPARYGNGDYQRGLLQQREPGQGSRRLLAPIPARGPVPAHHLQGRYPHPGRRPLDTGRRVDSPSDQQPGDAGDRLR